MCLMRWQGCHGEMKGMRCCQEGVADRAKKKTRNKYAHKDHGGPGEAFLVIVVFFAKTSS